MRVLLHMADRQPVDQRVRCAGLGDDLAGVEVEDDRLDALGAGIDADEKAHVKIENRSPQNPRASASRSSVRGRQSSIFLLSF